jgi:Dyp-type peroxidase family
MAEFTHDELSDLQGIVLSGFAHLRFAAYLFLRISDRRNVGAWLEDLSARVTTGRRWSDRPGGGKIKPSGALSVGLTFAGFEFLGLPEETLLSFAPEFRAGMASRCGLLGDTGESGPGKWELGGPHTDQIHVLLILNAADGQSLHREVQEHRALLEKHGPGIAIVSEQHGHRPDSDKEPFGSRDGISQPQIEGAPGKRQGSQEVIRAGEFVLGYLNEYDEYPPSPGAFETHDPGDILPRFPDGAIPTCKDFGCRGTYLVYRKLAQDVSGFWDYMARNAGRRPDGSVDTEDAVRLAAKCVGRWPSGAPLVLAPDGDNPELGRDRHRNNAFMYRPADAEGLACPIGAHVRRSNPRDARINEPPAESLRTVRRHRIVRRGISFGRESLPRDDVERGRLPVGAAVPRHSVGIHFVAINASIGRQFEMVQRVWCNEASFNGLYDNKDPVMGDNDGTGHMTIQRHPVRKRLRDIPRFVTMRGGAYFFVPSVRTLRFVARHAGAAGDR